MRGKLVMFKRNDKDDGKGSCLSLPRSSLYNDEMTGAGMVWDESDPGGRVSEHSLYGSNWRWCFRIDNKGFFFIIIVVMQLKGVFWDMMKRNAFWSCKPSLKVPMTRYLAYHMYMCKPTRKKKSFRNLKTRFFQALKCSYFVSKVSRRLVTN